MRSQEHWAQLPGNLWATIFSLAWSPRERLAPYKYQSWLFRLRTVCQSFKQIFEQHKDLNSAIKLGKDPGCHLLSLLQWLQQHRSQVKHLDVAYGSPWLEMTLVALQSPEPHLEKVHFHAVVPQTAILLLSSFHSITQCVLHSKAGLLMDLQPLSALPQLTDLTLQGGSYSGLDAAAHLTALCFKHAKADCTQDYCCVTSLVHLRLSSARITHFHHSNVAACSRLRSLSLCKAYIGDIDDEEVFSFFNEEAQIPSGLSALTALSSLELDTLGCKMNFDWVTVLSTLQVFQLATSQAVFPVSWSAMTCLRILRLAEADVFDYEQPFEEPGVKFQFDWGVLASLETLDLQYLSMRNMSLSGLSSLRHLRKVCFGHLKESDVDTTVEIAVLAFQLGRKKPEVDFSMPYDW